VTSFSVTQGTTTTHVLDATAHGWSDRASFPETFFTLAEALSPDGSQLAVADGVHLTMHNLDRGGVTWTTDADDQAASFGPDGTLYTVSATGTIRSRSTADGSIQYTLNPTSHNRQCCLFALVATGSHLLTAEANLFTEPLTVTVIDWPLTINDLTAAACEEAGRNLTKAEWTQYVGTFDAYEKTCADFP
jgi:hypothetical protein